MENEKISILIVDDEPELLELLSWDFEAKGFNVFTATGPGPALETLGTDTIDYVLSDLKMGNESGVDLLEKVYEQKILLKGFYIMSGFTDIENQDLRDKGLTKVFNKPLSPDTIIQYIHSTDK